MQNGHDVGLAETAPEQTTTEAAERSRGTVTRNPRIVAISRISNILDGLDEESRGRAVRFIAEEYAEFLGD